VNLDLFGDADFHESLRAQALSTVRVLSRATGKLQKLVMNHG